MATFRFTGDQPEVFPNLSYERDPELQPGQEFDTDQDLHHVRLERKGRGGKWRPTGALPELEEAIPDEPEVTT